MARMFHDIGRVEAAAGRSLDALHAALRVGARVTWQRLREKARQGGGDADVFARLGESIFRYLDELAAACSAGYAEARAEFAGEAERLRRPPARPAGGRPAGAAGGDRQPGRRASAGGCRAGWWRSRWRSRHSTRPARSVSAARAAVPLPPDVLVDLDRPRAVPADARSGRPRPPPAARGRACAGWRRCRPGPVTGSPGTRTPGPAWPPSARRCRWPGRAPRCAGRAGDDCRSRHAATRPGHWRRRRDHPLR